MRCERCGSEWAVNDPSIVVAECPFCHAPLAPDKPTQGTVADALRWVVDNRGIDALLDASAVNAVLSDLAAADEAGRKRVRLALACGGGGIYRRIWERSQGSPSAYDLREFRMLLEEEGISRDFSSSIVEVFAYATKVALPEDWAPTRVTGATTSAPRGSSGVSESRAPGKPVVRETPANPAIGATVNWALYADGTLVVNGTGVGNYRGHGSVLRQGKLDTSKDYFNKRRPIDAIPWEDCRDSIVSVEFASPTAPTSLASWFKGCSNLKSIDSANLFTSSVTNMIHVFWCCSSLSDLSPLASWDVSSVTDMRGMFGGCKSLSDLSPLASCDVSSVTNMEDMFWGCTSLFDLSPLATWDMSSVTDMSCLFDGCESLSDLSPLASWDVSSVKDMGYLFHNCRSLANLSPLATWTMSSVEDMRGMFGGCESLSDLSSLASWDVSSVTNMEGMFSWCKSLSDLAPLATWDVSSVTNMKDMFKYCESLSVAHLDDWMPADGCDISGTFNGCKQLETIYCKNAWKTVSSKEMGSFEFCPRLSSKTSGRKQPENERGASMANPSTGYFTLPGD